ncbi:MAG: cysteine synthase A [Clostridia bacterium]
MLYRNILEMIGNTPMIELKGIEKHFGLSAKIFAKLENKNYGGSAKDRVALAMIEDAEKRGILRAGATIIESTSGNTGIGLAWVGVVKGYRVILTMPDTMSVERQMLLRAYGAEIVLTDGKLGMQGASEKAQELCKSIAGGVILGQFDNKANPQAHYDTTAREIWRDMQGKIDVFVASFGTGGMISGCGKFLKEQNKDIQIVGVEPFSSPLVSRGVSGAHKIQGIGANFVPSILDKSVIDKIELATNDDAYAYAKLLAKVECLLVGISSGATLAVAVNLAQKKEYDGKNFVIVCTDNGERYLSNKLYE